MPVIYSNNASTTLSSGINNSTTTIPIASASGFPSIGSGEYYFATIANTNNTKIEVVKVTAGTTSLTVTRAQDGTTAQAFDSGDNFQLRVTAATLEAATKTDVNITAGAIAGAAISNDAIDSQHYADGSIDTAHIADSQITSAKIADSTIATADIADDAVTEDKLANAINTAIAANTAKTTNATHTGEVTGATALTIADNVVDEANLKVSNTPTNGYFLSAQSGNTGGLTWAEVDTTIANDSIDSQHYAAGSIDHEHLAADCVDGDNIQDDVINSEHIAAGAVDLEHMASQSVDEDNLYISNAGSNGQFLSKQTGNNGGLTWATVSSEDYIPDGSVMVFFQANAPTGWTKVTTQNDKTLRVVSGTGGGTGGDWAMSAGETTSSHGGHVHAGAAHAHSHNLSAGSHTLSTSEMPSHNHGSRTNGSSSDTRRMGSGNNSTFLTALNSGTMANAGGGGGHAHNMSGSISSGGDGNTSSAGSHTHTIAAPQYIDVIICSKDA